MTVVRPNGGETWHVGETQAIQWEAYDPDGVSASHPLYVDIHYDNDSGNGGYKYTIATSIVQTSPGSSEYLWHIPYHPYLISDRGRIRVTVTDRCVARAADESDEDFCPPPPSDTFGTLSAKGSTAQKVDDGGAVEFRSVSISAR